MFKVRPVLFGLVILMVMGICGGPVFAAPVSNAVFYEKKAYEINGKNVSAHVIIVDLSNSEIELTPVNTGKSLTEAVELKEAVEETDPVLLISLNGPLSPRNGNLMANSEMLYASYSPVSLGITERNKPVFARPMIFTRAYTGYQDGKRASSWAIRDINSKDQTGEQSILYTPLYGGFVEVTSPGWVLSVEESVIKAFFKVEVGRFVQIPENGYIIYFADKFTDTIYFQTPEAGRELKLEHTAMTLDSEEFDLESMAQILPGELRLVKNKEIDAGVISAGKTVIPRTAAGSLPDGRIVFVYCENAAVSELAEIMMKENCENAALLMSGSASLYVNGEYITPKNGQVLTAVVVKKVNP